MNPPNIKIYLAVSGVLIILFLFVNFYPFNKKLTTNQQSIDTNLPTPTSIEINQSSSTDDLLPTLPSADFTGVSDEEIPPEIYNAAFQKQKLRNQVPFDIGLFKIDFDYAEDKFIITLYEPKEKNRSQFDQWLKNNYPNLNINQFNFR